MKKLVLAALAIAAMAACTKSNVQFEQPGEIAFQPVAQKATKAAVDGNKYPTTENFNVWAWWGDNNATIDATYSHFADNKYIDKGSFKHRNDNIWSGVSPYYWPTTGSLVFAGYSPAENLGGTFDYSLNEKKFTITNYKQSANPANTKDLMWFDVTSQSYNTRVQTGSGVSKINAEQGVTVTFKHALSWLTFKFNVADADLSEKWTVTGVTLKNIKTKGNCEAEKDQPANWNFNDITQEDETMNVFTGAHPVTYKDSSEDNEAVDNDGVIVIPQGCTTVAVTFTQKNYVGGNTPSQTIELPLSAGIDGDAWLSGKHYIYTIVFSADEILIAPTVANWGNVIVTEDIPVEY